MLIRRLGIGLLLLLAACSPFEIKNIEPPELPEQYLAAAATEGGRLTDRWWESFNDPHLNRLQEQLFSGNLDLQQALHRLEQREALERISGAGLWPSLTLSGALNREKTPGVSSSALASTQRVSLAASYEVDLWNRLHDRTEAARLRSEAGRLETETLLLSLSAQLAEQYFIAAEQRAQRQLVAGQIDHYRELVTTISNRYRSGLATARELYQARQNLTRAEALLPQFETGISRAENRIALLLGQLPQAQLTRIDQLPEIGPAVAIGLPASLLNRRPDLQAALSSLRAADQELAAALADRLPTIDLSATAFYSATQLASGDIDGTFWTLILGLTQPLLDGGRRAAESDRQRASRDELLAGYRKALIAAVQEVETAQVADRNSAARLHLLQQQLQASEQERFHAQENYRYGLLSSQDLLASEIRFLETSSQNISAHRQWLIDRISLARALGGGWMTDELEQQQQTLSRLQDQK